MSGSDYSTVGLAMSQAEYQVLFLAYRIDAEQALYAHLKTNFLEYLLTQWVTFSLRE
jgi:hypothetical protein